MVVKGIFLNWTGLEMVLMASDRFVWCGYYTYYLIASFYQLAEAFYCKIGSTEVYNSQVFLVHVVILLKSRPASVYKRRRDGSC